MFRIKIDTDKLNKKAYEEFQEFTRNQNYNLYYDNGVLYTHVFDMEELDKYPNLKQYVNK